MNQYYFGESLLVEDTRKIAIGDLLKQVQVQAKEFLISNNAEILGNKIKLCFSKTGFGGSRIWFSCPSCSKRVGVLYTNKQEVVACRICLGLKYRKSRFSKMIESSTINSC